MNLNLLENKYFFAVTTIFLSLYAAQVRPKLPQFLVKLFQNPIFRVAILYLVLVRGYKDPQFSILVAVSFIIIMNLVTEHIMKENFTDVQGIDDTPTYDINNYANINAVDETNNSNQNVAEECEGNTVEGHDSSSTNYAPVQESNIEKFTDEAVVQKCENLQKKLNTINNCITNVKKEKDLLNCDNLPDAEKDECKKKFNQLNGLHLRFGGAYADTEEELNKSCNGVPINVSSDQILADLSCDNV